MAPPSLDELEPVTAGETWIPETRKESNEWSLNHVSPYLSCLVFRFRGSIRSASRDRITVVRRRNIVFTKLTKQTAHLSGLGNPLLSRDLTMLNKIRSSSVASSKSIVSLQSLEIIIAR